MDWTKITKGAGDSGKTDLLFMRGVPKSDPVFRVLSALELAHISIASVAAQVLDQHPIEVTAFIEELDQQLVLVMGAVAGYNAPARYRRHFGFITENHLDTLDELVQRAGVQLNEAAKRSGWIPYSRVRDPLRAALTELGGRVRAAEIELYSWQHEAGLSGLELEKRILNRASKVTHLLSLLKPKRAEEKYESINERHTTPHQQPEQAD